MKIKQSRPTNMDVNLSICMCTSACICMHYSFLLIHYMFMTVDCFTTHISNGAMQAEVQLPLSLPKALSLANRRLPKSWQMPAVSSFGLNMPIAIKGGVLGFWSVGLVGQCFPQSVADKLVHDYCYCYCWLLLHCTAAAAATTTTTTAANTATAATTTTTTSTASTTSTTSTTSYYYYYYYY